MNKRIDITNVVLTTNRLILRPWRTEDLSDLYEYARVDGVGQMAGWTPHRSIAESGEILNCFIREKKPLRWNIRERSLAPSESKPIPKNTTRT